jgi:hypothetical protein
MTSLCCCSCGKLIGAREEWTLQCGYSESRQMVPMIVHGTCARAHAAATRDGFRLGRTYGGSAGSKSDEGGLTNGL